MLQEPYLKFYLAYETNTFNAVKKYLRALPFQGLSLTTKIV